MPHSEGSGRNGLVERTAEIVAAYVSTNTVLPWELASLIRAVHQALTKAASGPIEAPTEPLKPAVPIRASVAGDYIICLEDGMRFIFLKRHLRIKHGMSPQEYRQRWGLPADYPIVAPNYGLARSLLAKQMGLGRKWPPRTGDARAGSTPGGRC